MDFELTAILGVVVSIAYSVVLLRVGDILKEPYQLRIYLGMDKSGDFRESFEKVAELLVSIGKILRTIAILTIIIQVLTFLNVVFRLFRF